MNETVVPRDESRVVDDASRPGEEAAVWMGAVRGRFLVEVLGAGDASPSVVEPYATIDRDGATFLIGWCRSGRCVRFYRTDRISGLTVTSTTFAPEHREEVADVLAAGIHESRD